jgi:hypothetical protein
MSEAIRGYQFTYDNLNRILLGNSADLPDLGFGEEPGHKAFICLWFLLSLQIDANSIKYKWL